MSTTSAAAAACFDHTMNGFLLYRADTSHRLKAALAADPDCALLHVLKGSFTMLASNARMVPMARDAAARAAALASLATPREGAHAAALAAWADGEMDRALAIWSGIVAEHPHDILAFRLHHYNAFWRGRPDAMLSVAEAILPRWDAGMPGYGSVLACRAFANEETGHYTVAEASGRAAVAIDPADLWAAHAVAHVMEMQGRRSEGIAWIEGLEAHWDGGNNLMHHLWWHRALYHLERDEHDRVLKLYDGRFRDLASPLTLVMPDLSIDMQNAISMLFRLELRGVAVGDRWVELADKAEGRVGDCQSGFTLPHWMMALTATGRWDAAARLLEGMRDFSRNNHGTLAPVVGGVALPICEAVLKRAQGDHAGAADAMRPILSRMYTLGGSHAQQDLLEQLFLDVAMRAGLRGDARMLLERVAGRHPVPPERRAAYAKAARDVSH